MRAITVAASVSTRSNARSSSTTTPTRTPTPLPSSRRDLLAGVLAGAALIPGAAIAADLPPAPSVGDCPECIGEVNNSLNACSLESASCVSTLNDDEVHFAAPWQFDSTAPAAVERLIEVATGGAYDPGLIQEPFGVSRVDAAVFIAKGVGAVLSNSPENYPSRPERRRRAKTDFVPFDGVLVDSRTTENGSAYVRITLGGSSAEANPVGVIDAEFLFLKDDNIVNVRAASRVEPQTSGLSGGELALSFTSGLVVDRNTARRRMDALRTALGWDLVPVLTDFNPQFNPEVPSVVEKVFRPFESAKYEGPSGVAYPSQ